MSTQNEPSDSPDIQETSITIYGGKKDEVGNDAKSILGIGDDEYYGTWLSMGIMRRLGFLFDGGVESAGGLGEIVCMFALLVIILAVFAFWSVAVVFIVVIVLTLLSGGAAYKFIRAVYITTPLSGMDNSKIDEFVSEQLAKGRFVKIEGIGTTAEMSATTKSSSTAASHFRRGIQFSLFIATIFLITEVIYFLMNQHWLSGLNVATADFEILVLTMFGLLFLIGIVLMDIGVLLRRRIARSMVES
ncbi:MAG: hypothetical protein ACTSU3_06270 [Candidatus Thorarchaeota archaeon]